MTLVKFLSAMGIAVLFSLQAQAANYKWIGTTNSWNTATNWQTTTSPGIGSGPTASTIPGSSDYVWIPSGSPAALLTANVNIGSFNMQGGSIDLSNYTFNISSSATSATFSNGTITTSGTGTLTAGSFLTTFNMTNMTVNVAINTTSARIIIQGCTFSKGVTINRNASDSNIDAWFGNTFQSTLSVVMSCTAGAIYTGYGGNADQYNGNVTLVSAGDNSFRFAYAGTPAGTITKSYFGGNITISKPIGSGTVSFGGPGTSCEQSSATSSFAINTGNGFKDTGILIFENFTKQGSNTTTLLLTVSTALKIHNSTFNGPVNFSAPSLIINYNSTVSTNPPAYTGFASTATLTKTGSTADIWPGTSLSAIGFDQDVTITNSGTGSLNINCVDLNFNGNASFVKSGASAGSLIVAGQRATYFYKNVTYTTSNTADAFPYRCFFEGSNNQVISGNTTPVFNGDLMFLKDPSTTITLNTPVKVGTVCNIDKCKVISSLTNPLILANNAYAFAYTYDGFIEGPVKQIGTTGVYPIPLGKGSQRSNVSLTSSSSTADAVIEYFNSTPSNSTLLGTGLKDISSCEYWNLQSTSAANYTVQVKWDPNYNCSKIEGSGANLALASYAASQWNFMQSTSNTGDFPYGSNTLNGTVNALNGSIPFTLGYKTLLTINTQNVNTTNYSVNSSYSAYYDFVSGTGGTNGGLAKIHPDYYGYITFAIYNPSTNTNDNLIITTDANAQIDQVFKMGTFGGTSALGQDMYTLNPDHTQITFKKFKKTPVPAHNISTNLVNGVQIPLPTGFTLTAPGYTNVQLEVSDKTGTVMKTASTTLTWNCKKTDNTTDAPDGVYKYKVIFNGGQAFYGQMILKR